MGKMNTVQNGKGPDPRPTDLRKYWDRFEEIDWHREPKIPPPKKEDKNGPSK